MSVRLGAAVEHGHDRVDVRRHTSGAGESSSSGRLVCRGGRRGGGRCAMVPQQRPRPVDQGAMQSHMPARSAQVDQGAKSSHMPARNAQGVPLGRSRWGHSSYSWCSPRLAAPAAPVPSALEATCHLARGDRSSSVARSWRPMRCEKPWAKDEAQRLAPSCAAARDLRSAERAGSFSRSRGEFSPATRTYDGYPPRLFVFSFTI